MKPIDMTAKTAVVAAIKVLGTGQGRATAIARKALQNKYWETASENVIGNIRSAMLGRPDIFHKVEAGLFELTADGLELLGEFELPKPRLVVDNTAATEAESEPEPELGFDAEAVMDAVFGHVQHHEPRKARVINVEGLAVLVMDGEEFALELGAGTEDDRAEINDSLQGFLDSEQARNEAGYEDASALPMSVLDELAA